MTILAENLTVSPKTPHQKHWGFATENARILRALCAHFARKMRAKCAQNARTDARNLRAKCAHFAA